MTKTLTLCLLISLSYSVNIRWQSDIASTEVKQTGSPILPIQSADWVATDALGRQLPTAKETGPFRKNRYVGIFYFLWHGQHGDKVVYDITKLTKANSNHPAFGPAGAFHWWGEPEAGYYRSDDPWVIRRNLQMLTMAGVDVLFFDVTNASTYLPVVTKLCAISLSMRSQGIPTPYVCFVTYTKSAETVAQLYQRFYSPGLYSALWFRWQGKPLILGIKEETKDNSIRDFFTWRFSWAWTDAKNQPHQWQWIDNSPQDYGWDTDPKVPEEIPVSVAGHPTLNIGKSNSRGRQSASQSENLTKSTDRGLYFDEQWKRALQVKPELVFVTGWNEWIAQKFVAGKADETKFLGKSAKAGQPYFIDLYNREYNRDIEPMKDGYNDTYYYQLVANVRRFKGIDKLKAVSKPRQITIDGSFDEWYSVEPIYRDAVGDVLHRDYPGFGEQIKYVNKSGRNDIIESRITHDLKNLYVYVRTNENLTVSTDKNWMLLYIDSDQSYRTGWLGYDFVINKSIKMNKTSISKWNGRAFREIDVGAIAYNQREIEIAIPLRLVHQSFKNVRIDFHWADNQQIINNVNDFFTNGDSAPDRRFNYRYSY